MPVDRRRHFARETQRAQKIQDSGREGHPQAEALLNWVNAELSPKRYWRGPKSQEVGGRGRLYLSLQCHHKNDSCTKTGSNEGHFNEGKVTRQCPETAPF